MYIKSSTYIAHNIRYTCTFSGGYGFCLATHSAWPIRRRGIQKISFYEWPIVQDTGAPTTHDKPGSLRCSV